jgi:hypothetical protein
MESIDLNEVIAAALFALGAIVAFVVAFAKTVRSRAIKVETAIGLGLAGLFALVIDAALLGRRGGSRCVRWPDRAVQRDG